jgi:hypothetical protein
VTIRYKPVPVPWVCADNNKLVSTAHWVLSDKWWTIGHKPKFKDTKLLKIEDLYDDMLSHL